MPQGSFIFLGFGSFLGLGRAGMALNKGKAETQIVGFPHHNLLQAPTAILGLGMELHAEVPSEGGGMEQEHKDPSHLEPLSQFLGKERDGGLDRIAKPASTSVPNQERNRNPKHRLTSYFCFRWKYNLSPNMNEKTEPDN